MARSPTLLRSNRRHLRARTNSVDAPGFARSRPSRSPANPVTLTKSLTKILIVHASPVLRLGLTGLIRRFRSFRICAQTEDVRAGRELFAHHRPDLVIVGLTLRHGDGVSLIKDLKKSAAGVRIMVLSQRTDVLSLQRSFRAGAMGYLAAHEALSEFPRALSQVAAGEIYASPQVARLVLQIIAGGEMKPTVSESKLSDRELQIFALIGRGLGPTRVAKELHLSVKTIETHRMRIQQKLGLQSGADLNRHAEDWLMNQNRKRGWNR